MTTSKQCPYEILKGISDEVEIIVGCLTDPSMARRRVLNPSGLCRYAFLDYLPSYGFEISCFCHDTLVLTVEAMKVFDRRDEYLKIESIKTKSGKVLYVLED